MIFCNICGREAEVIHNNDYPFVDGRKHGLICFICFSVPKKWVLINDEWVESFAAIHTVKEMEEHGWSKSESLPSIVAIKKLLLNKKDDIVVDGLILDKLFIECELT